MEDGPQRGQVELQGGEGLVWSQIPGATSFRRSSRSAWVRLRATTWAPARLRATATARPIPAKRTERKFLGGKEGRRRRPFLSAFASLERYLCLPRSPEPDGPRSAPSPAATRVQGPRSGAAAAGGRRPRQRASLAQGEAGKLRPLGCPPEGPPPTPLKWHPSVVPSLPCGGRRDTEEG